MFGKNEEILIAIILGTFLSLFLMVITIVAVVKYKFRQQKYLQEKQLLETRFSQILLQSQVEIQEQTLQHLSCELHDNLGQVATLIKINLNTIDLENTERAFAKIENTKNLTRQLITDIKALSVNLSGDRLLQSCLARALEFETEQLNKTGQFITTFSLEGLVPEINTDTAIILYRMSQEAINNIVKHSKARHIDISLSGTSALIKLTFADDGIGFNPQEQINNNGAGLRNLRNRARLINAALNIQIAPGKGATIEIALPL